MLAAVIAAVIAALAVILICAMLVVVYQRRRSMQATPRKDVNQLKTLDLSSDGEGPSSRKSRKREDVHVTDSHTSVKKPSESLHGRFIALGVLGAAIFGSLGTKLWSLQVLANSEYQNEADKNIYSTMSTPAPRGCIYDAEGQPLAINRSIQTVLADADVASDRDTVRRLSAVLGIPATVVKQRIEDSSAGAQSARVVADDARLRDVAFISEHASAFPGVKAETRTVREYPYGALGAHVIGYTSSVTEDDMNGDDGRNIESTDTIGKAGVESYYDSVIAGDHGSRRVMVDAKGNVLEIVSETKPSKGSDIILTLDARMQCLADTILQETIAPGGVIGTGKGVSGAAVVMDVRDGAVKAMASYPTYDPSNFTGGVSQDVWDIYNPADDDPAKIYAPLNNRCINGLYAAASTYKAFTSLAGLEYGYTDLTKQTECLGEWDGFNTGAPQKCWDHSGHGWLDLYHGIVASCDVVFYEIAKAFYDHGPDGTGEISQTALQDYLSRFNLDKPTGIDLAGESSGRIPTPEWKAEYFRNRPADSVWRGGDYTNMIIGQGDVLVTPLQIAAAYGGIATGRIMKPHLLGKVMNADGDVVVESEPEVVSALDVNMNHLSFVRDALRGVIGDSSAKEELFVAENVKAAGKSGTAEHTDRADDAWFVAYAPYDNPKYVAVCIVEQGGGGSEVAAPVVAKLLGEMLKIENGESELKAQAVSGWAGAYVDYAGASGARTD